MLSLQTFACHGIIHNGVQKCLLNKKHATEQYFDFIEVEATIRKKAPEMPRVYFLVLFACCRESYISEDDKKNLGRKAISQLTSEQKNQQTVANFTFVFGCDPALGVAANTKLVMAMVEHLNSYFDPDDGHAMIPDCFNAIDAMKDEIQLEATSCNLGKNLRLMRQDNRVGLKQLIVIIKNPRKEGRAIKAEDVKKDFKHPWTYK